MTNPAANFFHRGKADTNDTISSDTSAIDGGQTAVQTFAGCHFKLAIIHPLCDTSKEQLLGSVQDRVFWHGTSDELIANNASVYNRCKFLSVYLGVNYHDQFILSVQTCMLFLNDIGNYTGRDPSLDYGEYYWTYNASSSNSCVFWYSCKEADEQEKQ